MSDQSTSDGHSEGVSATPPKPAAWWEDFIDIFYAPSQVFARRANSGFFLPMVVVTLLVGVITLGTGRTTVLQGIVHLVIFAVFLFFAVVP